MPYKKTLIFEHCPKPSKPKTKSEFGYWLAGLIDSDGHISKAGYVQIDFDIKHLSVSHYVSHVIGYGKISRDLLRNTVRYRCTESVGCAVIAQLVVNKLKHNTKIDQFNKRLVFRLKRLNYDVINTNYVNDDIMQTHWLSGFLQGDGSLVLSLVKVPNKPLLKTTITVNVSQKSPELLNLIKVHFGGTVGYRKAQDTHYYISNSFTNAAKFIFYCDRFQFIGNKYAQYKIWRSAYVLFQNHLHLTEQGVETLARLKNNLSALRTFDSKHLSIGQRELRLKQQILRREKRQNASKA